MTAPFYGKREPGALTAASPGDTLHFNFASFNDSGNSEALTGLVVSDIKVFKDGDATARATDSGYSLISDTGMMGNRPGLYRFRIQLFNTADDAAFYASGSWYQVAVDAVAIDGQTVRFWCGSFEIGRQRVDVREIVGDTGAAGWLKNTFASGFTDTGLNERLGRIQSDVDTGLRTHIDDLDTGLHAHISDVDTGLHAILLPIGFDVDTGLRAQLSDVDTGLHDTIADLDTGLRDFIDDTDTGIVAGVWAHTSRTLTAFAFDTGIAQTVWRESGSTYTDTGSLGYMVDNPPGATVDTGVVNQAVWQTNAQRKLTVDTGIADQVWKTTTAGYADDTGTFGELLRIPATASVDTGQVNQAVWQANAVREVTAISDTGMNERFARIQSDVDTGLRVHIDDLDTGLTTHFSSVTVTAFSDTGVNDRLGKIGFDVDTGLRAQLSDVDTGLHDAIADLDTGLRDHVDNTDTGLRARLNTLAEDTGGVSVNALFGDTGAAQRLMAAFVGGFADTGLNQRLGQIQSDVDTGLRAQLSDVDTGLHDAIADLDTGLRDFINDTDTGLSASIAAATDTGLIANAAAIRAKTDSLTFTVAGQVDANIQYVNDVAIAGAGDTGTGNVWRPA